MSRLQGGRQSRVGWPALSQASGGSARGYKGPHSSRTYLLSFLSLQQAGPTAERSEQEYLLFRWRLPCFKQWPARLHTRGEAKFGILPCTIPLSIGGVKWRWGREACRVG